MNKEEAYNEVRKCIEEISENKRKIDIENIIYIMKKSKNKKASTC